VLYSKLLYDVCMPTAKQNQKFPFYFLSAPPTPPAENLKERKENFWFLLPRPKGADEARIIGHQGSARNSIELCLTHTAKIQNSNSRKKCGRAEGATLGLNPRRIQNPKGFSTRGKARRLPIQCYE